MSNQQNLNKVRERMLFLSPTVQAGWEPESKRDDFEEVKLLGQGAFGVVKKVIHKKTNITYAIKVIEKQLLKKTNMIEQMKNEVHIMYSLNHPYILKLYNHFEDDTNIYLVLEFVSGGQLYAVLWKQPQKRFDEKTAAKFILQTALALEAVHSKNIIHRDIKPENLLLDDQQNIKLADFGWSNFLKPNEIRQTFCGTLDYLAPEMLEQQRQHNHTVDIWAVGVLCFELLTGLSPFAPAGNPNDQRFVEKSTKENIKELKYTFPTNFPDGAKDLVKLILVKDQSKRPSAADIRKHPWIESNTREVKIPSSIKVEPEKKIVKNSEIENLSKDGKLAFTNDQIYDYSRPDSIIVKDYLQGENKDTKMIAALNNQIKELMNKNHKLDQDLQKKSLEAEDLKLTVELLKKQNPQQNAQSQELLAMQQKLKLQDERYTYTKGQYEAERNKNIELERRLREFELQAKEYEALKLKVGKYKEETESYKMRARKAEDQIQQMIVNGINEKEFGQNQQEDSNNIDNLIKKLQNKHTP